MAVPLRSIKAEVDVGYRPALHGLNAVEEAGDDVVDSLERTERQARKVERRMKALKGATVVMGAVAVGSALAIGKIAQAGMRVDSVLAEVEATSGATVEQMDRIRTTAQQLGADTPLAMYDIAEAFRELSYAGLSAEESVAAVAGVADLAVAGNLEVADAARIATSALNQFSLEADQTESIAAQMAGTYASSAITVGELGEAMNYVGAAAAAAGQDMTEVNGILGTLADRGLRGSMAGTSLQQFLTKLAKPSEKAAGALEQLGLSSDSFLDKNGDFKDMSEIVAILSSRLEDLPEGERLSALSTIFGVRGARAIAPLIGNVDDLNEKIATIAAADIKSSIQAFEDLDNAALRERNRELDALAHPRTVQLHADMTTREAIAGFRSLRDELTEEELTVQIQTALNVDDRAAEILAGDIMRGAGTDALTQRIEDATSAADLSAAKMNTVAGQIENLTGSISSFFYTAYSSFEPLLAGGLGILNDFVDLLSANAQVAKVFGIGLIGLAGAATFLTGVLGAAYIQLWMNNVATSALTSNTYGAAIASEVMGAAQFIMANGLRASAAAAWALMAPLWPLIAVGLALGAAYYAYTNNLWGFRDAVNSLLAPLGDFAGWLWDITKAAGAFALDVLVGALDTAKWALGGIIDNVRGVIQWFNSLSTAGKAGILILLGPLGLLIAAGIGLYRAFEYVAPAARWLWTQLSRLAGVIGRELQPVLDWLGNAARVVGDGLGMMYDAVVEAGAAYRRLTNDTRALTTPLIGLFGWLSPVGDRFRWLAGQTDEAAYAVGFLVGIVEGVLGLALAPWVWGWNRAMTAAQPVVRVLAGAFDTTISTARTLLGLGLAAWTWGVTRAGRAARPVISGFEDAVRTATRTGRTMTNLALAPWLWAVDRAARTVRGGMALVRSGVNLVLAPIRTLISLAEKARNALSGLPGSGLLPKKGRGREAGRATGKGFAKGASEGERFVDRATRKLAQTAGKYLPSSDAERGPLANLSKMGKAIPAMLAGGILANESELEYAVRRLARTAEDGIPDTVAGPTVTPTTAPAPAVRSQAAPAGSGVGAADAPTPRRATGGAGRGVFETPRAILEAVAPLTPFGLGAKLAARATSRPRPVSQSSRSRSLTRTSSRRSFNVDVSVGPFRLESTDEGFSRADADRLVRRARQASENAVEQAIADALDAANNY